MSAFITGCDESQAWMIPWFLKNYRTHNKKQIVFVDFGVKPSTLHKVEQWFDGVIPFVDRDDYFVRSRNLRTWYLKPMALIESRRFARIRCWMDLDCEVLGDISGIFDHIEYNKLSMVEDRPWSIRRGEKWHNSGVVACIDIPRVLDEWHMSCRAYADKFPGGDQDVLHSLLHSSDLLRTINIVDLPNEYNWLRLQLVDGQDSPKKLVMHWTGPKGKDEIRRKIDERGPSYWERELSLAVQAKLDGNKANM